MCANWLTARLHHIIATVHLPTLQSIDSTLVADPEIDLLGLFAADDADMDAICVRKTIYLPTPFMGSSWSATCRLLRH